MLEDPRLPVAPIVAVQEAAAPSPDVPTVDGTELPQPSIEQARTADQVFTGPVQRDPVTTLFGVLTSAFLLRDVAVDTFAASDEEEEEERSSGEENDNDSAG